MHGNMLTVNGARMGKSKGNAILPRELFSGEHDLLEKGYDPMVLRYLFLQTHYGSQMDLSVQALDAAEKGFVRIKNTLRAIQLLRAANDMTYLEKGDPKKLQEIEKSLSSFYYGMNDDFNTARGLSALSGMAKMINALANKQMEVADFGADGLKLLFDSYETLVVEVLGLEPGFDKKLEQAYDVILAQYNRAKIDQDYEKVDSLRAQATDLGIVFKDSKAGARWDYNGG
jgi:cysteinyl-tRNA synthetase